jgi:hypothetical protein
MMMAYLFHLASILPLLTTFGVLIFEYQLDIYKSWPNILSTQMNILSTYWVTLVTWARTCSCYVTLGGMN